MNRLKWNINPFDRANPISLKEAAALSAMTATATYFLTFLVNLSAAEVMLDLGAFFFESFKTWMAAFWGTLITLAGLEQWIKRGEKK